MGIGLGLACAAAVLAAVMTGFIRQTALNRGVLDIPNERSSHTVPTPRGGGAAIVVATTLALLVLAMLGIVERRLLMALVGGGLAVAGIGLVDDYRTVPPLLRLVVHFFASAWAIWCLDGFPPLRIGDSLVPLGATGYVLGTIAIVWGLNLFNFLDGIDGFAASEAVFISIAGAALLASTGVGGGLPAAGFAFGAACAGFLLWNWPPAKIFMGDVGSGYIGFVIAVLALAAGHAQPAAWIVWLILGGVFFVDATVTLIRRLARREQVFQAHRSHAYQWLARRWSSHLRVTSLVVAVNVLWLLPCAYLATRDSQNAAWFLALAWAPILLAVCIAGAGRPERRGN